MTTGVDQFWQHAVASGLLAQAQVEQLAATYRAAHGDTPPDAVETLARWLVETRLLSAYQAAVLQAGHPGPFFYGDYLVYHRYGPGPLVGMFRAVHVPTQHVVVLRFLSGPATQNPGAMARLAERLGAAAALAGEPRLSRAWTLVDLAQYKFAVAETIDGEPLDEWLTKAGPQPVGEACRIVREAALAVAPLHTAGGAHGSLHSGGVLRTAAGGVQVLGEPLLEDPLQAATRGDGLPAGASAARALLSGQAAQDGPAQISAALAVAPELLIGGTRPDPRSDVYALGWLLFQLLTAQTPPRDPQQAADRLRARIVEPMPALDAVSPPLPPQMQKLLGYFLARDPSGRYQSATHVAEALAAYAALSPVKAGPPVTSSTAAAFSTWLANSQAEQPAGETTEDFSFNVDLAAATAPVPTMRAAKEERTPPRRSPLPRIMAIVSVAVALVVSIYTLRGRFAAAPAREDLGGLTPSARQDEPETQTEVPAPVKTAVADEGPLGPPLWERPGDGEPISLAWLPAGAQLIVALDAAALSAHPEGGKLLDALGPIGEKLNADINALTGVTLAQIEHVLVGFYDMSPAPAEAAWVLRGRSSWDLSQLPVGKGEATEISGETVHQSAEHAAFTPVPGSRMLVVCPKARLEEVLAAGGKVEPLRREFQMLLAASDDNFALNVLFSPTFLTRGGKALVPEELRPLDALVEEFLGANATAALLSVQLDRDLFIELSVHGTAERPPLAVGQGLRERLLGLPSRIGQHLATLKPSEYSRAVLEQFPRMVQTAIEYTRTAVVDRHTVLRAYLPVEAGASLIWGTRLALRESPRGPGGSVVAKVSKPIAELLKQPYSMSFPRAPLDKTLAQLGADLGIEIIILGADLQLEGITKNQSLVMDERDSTAGAILRKILMLANRDGKLVYVVKPRPDGTGEALFITTRTAAAGRGDPLPAEYAAAPK